MKRRQWYEGLLVLLTFATLTVAMTWPVTARLKSRLIGDTIDLWVAQWDNWWLLTALQQGLDPWFTPYLFFPHGINLTYHSFSWSNMLLWLPLQAFLGRIAAYNLTILLTFVLAGAGMYYLARDLTDSRPAAALAGMIYAFAPYHVWESLGHPNLTTIQWLPLGLLFLRRAIRQPEGRTPWLAGLFLGLSGLAGAHMLIFTSLLTGLYLSVTFLFFRRHWNKQTWRQLTLIATIVVILTLPITFPVVRDVLRGGSPGKMLLDESVQSQADLLAFFLPGSLQMIGGNGSTDAVGGDARFSAYLGVVPVTLAIIAAVGNLRHSVFWLGSTFLWMILALGSQLRVSGRLIDGVSLPYGWLAWTPVMGVIRVPARFNILVGLSLAAVAGIGGAIVLRRVRRPVLRHGLALGLATLLLLEYASWPFPTSDPTVSPYFSSRQEKGAVLTLPPGRQNAKFAMYEQTFHERPLVEGVAARVPAGAYEFLASIPILQLPEDQRMQHGPLPGITSPSEQLMLLAESGVESIILNKKTMWPDLLVQWRDFFTVRPTYQDDDIIVYTTQPTLGREYELVQSFPNGVGIIQATLSSTEIVQGEPIWLDIRWGAAEPLQPGLRAELRLLDTTGTVAHAQEWSAPSASITIAKQKLALSPFIPPGHYELELVLFEKDKGVGALLLPAKLVVRARERLFEVAILAQPIDVSFGGLFDLLSYELDADGKGIQLQWRALDRPPADYKLFVHLINPVGEIVAQWDGMPRGWNYPTSWWEAQEIVEDHVRLDSAPVEDCYLRVGWYDPLTGRRLTTSEGEEFILIPVVR